MERIKRPVATFACTLAMLVWTFAPTQTGYAGTKGAHPWQDHLAAAEARAIAVEGGQLFAAGVGTNARGGLDWLVRAYDAQTGALLWQDLHDRAGRFDAAQAVVAEG